jgi:Domain of unknown function (DUF4157)
MNGKPSKHAAPALVPNVDKLLPRGTRRPKSDPAASLHCDKGSWQGLQCDAGNLAMQSLFRSGSVLTKLIVGNPDDPAEREADQVAHTIMRKAAGVRASSPCEWSHAGEICGECQQMLFQPTIIRRATAPSVPAHVSRIVSDVLRSPGHPLDSATRAFFEPRFGRNFGDVRIHTGP